MKHNITINGIEDFYDHKNNICWSKHHDKIKKNPYKFIDKIRNELEPEFQFNDIYDSALAYYNTSCKDKYYHLRGLTNAERELFKAKVGINYELIYCLCKYENFDIQRRYVDLPIDLNEKNSSSSVRFTGLTLPEKLTAKKYEKKIIEKILNFNFEDDEKLKNLSNINNFNLHYNKFSKIQEAKK